MSPVFCERGTAAPDSVSLTIVRGVFHLSTEPCHAGDLFPPAKTIHTHRKHVSASLGGHISGCALNAWIHCLVMKRLNSGPLTQRDSGKNMSVCSSSWSSSQCHMPLMEAHFHCSFSSNYISPVEWTILEQGFFFSWTSSRHWRLPCAVTLWVIPISIYSLIHTKSLSSVSLHWSNEHPSPACYSTMAAFRGLTGWTVNNWQLAASSPVIT